MTIHELALSNEHILEIEIRTNVNAFGLKIDTEICKSRLSRDGKNIAFNYHAYKGKYVYPTISLYDNIERWETVDKYTIMVYLPFKPSLSKTEIKVMLNDVYGKMGVKNAQDTNPF